MIVSQQFRLSSASPPSVRTARHQQMSGKPEMPRGRRAAYLRARCIAPEFGDWVIPAATRYHDGVQARRARLLQRPDRGEAEERRECGAVHH